MDEGKDLQIFPKPESSKKLEFTVTPRHVRKTRAWQSIHLETIDNSVPKPDGFLDMDKIDKDTLNEYYRRKAEELITEPLPDRIKNDAIFRDHLKEFGKQEALKQYFYREDLRIEEAEEIRRIQEERKKSVPKLH